jgi:cyanate permease
VNQHAGEQATYSSYRWLILLVGCLAIVSYAIQLIVLVPLFGEISKDLKVDMSACLNLSMVFVIVVSFANTFGGIVVDKLRLTLIYVGSLLCSCIPAVMMPWVGDSYWAVAVARMIQGPSAVAFCTIGPIVALWFPSREQGLAGGVLMCMMSVGTAIGLVATPAVLEYVGTWQKTVALFSIPGWITIILAVLFTRRQPPVQHKLGPRASMTAGRETYLTVLRNPLSWVGTLLFFLNAWGFYGLLNVVPPWLAMPGPMGLGLGAMTSGKLSLLVPIMGIPAFVLGGIFYDKVAKEKSRPAIWIAFLMTGFLAYLLPFSVVYRNMVLLTIVLMGAGFGLPFMGASLTAFIAKNYPPHLVGSLVGLWFGLGSLGGALGIYMAGLATVLTGSFDWGFRLITLAAAGGLVLTFALKPRISKGAS